MGVVFLGYRGSGKTSLGRRVAEALSLPFVDTDEEITRTEGRSIKAIFETDGEDYFRDCETKALADALSEPNRVVSIGGGAVLRQQNRKMLVASPHVKFYLSCDVNELARRIRGDAKTAENRPPLTKLGGGVEEIRSLLEARTPMYREVASQEIDVTQRSLQEAVAGVLEVVRKAD